MVVARLRWDQLDTDMLTICVAEDGMQSGSRHPEGPRVAVGQGLHNDGLLQPVLEAVWEAADRYGEGGRAGGQVRASPLCQMECMVPEIVCHPRPNLPHLLTQSAD